MSEIPDSMTKIDSFAQSESRIIRRTSSPPIGGIARSRNTKQGPDDGETSAFRKYLMHSSPVFIENTGFRILQSRRTRSASIKSSRESSTIKMGSMVVLHGR